MFALDTVCEFREIADRAEYLAKQMAGDQRQRLMAQYRDDLLRSAVRLADALNSIDATLTEKEDAQYGKAA